MQISNLTPRRAPAKAGARGCQRCRLLLWVPPFAGALALAGCGQRASNDTLEQAEAQASADAADSGFIPCALAGAAEFERDCTLDRVRDDDGLVLTLRHPDGGFRRLLVTTDGRGVVAADGAERAVVSVVGQGEIEVALGGDRYRLPARVGTR